MPDVFTVLGQDHAEVKQMLSDLESGPTRMGGASTAQLESRKKLVQALVIAESKHEAVEEEHFWPVVRDLSGDGPALAGQGTDQEQEAKVILDRLDKLDPSDDDFEELVAAGHRLRVYVPFGTDWYEYSVRRLQENPKIAGYVAADTLGRFLPF